MLGGFCLNDWLIARGYLRLKCPVPAVRDFHESLVDWSQTRAWAWKAAARRWRADAYPI
jgi:predicted AlkP superfamily phosphohydrolase/phosphomutase